MTDDEEKWRGAVTRIVDVPPAKLWDLASDFCGLCRWMPLVDECRRVDGDGDRCPGSVRFVSGTSLPRQDGAKSWITEKLLAIDPKSRTFTYALVDGNIDAISGGYTSTFSVSEFEQDPERSLVEWKFEITAAADAAPAAAAASSRAKQDEAVQLIEAALASNITSLVLAVRGDSLLVKQT